MKADWKPIATAPKDGTEILLCDPLDADGNPTDQKTWGLFVQVAAWWADDENPTAGEWTVYCSMVEDPRLHFTPTHWAELPAPP